MAAERYDVIFIGTLQAGADPAQVRENMARLFKTEPARIEHLFSGQPVTIKKGVDAATGRQYVDALAKAGALADLAELIEAPPAPASLLPPASDVKASPAPATPRGAPVTVPPAIAARSAPPQAPGYSVAEPGVILVEVATPSPVRIDTAHLSVAAAGELLVEPSRVEAPTYDLSALSLDPPGTQLSEARPVPPPQYDLSRLALE